MMEERVYVKLGSKRKTKLYTTRILNEREISRTEVDKLMEELKYNDSDAIKKRILDQKGLGSEDPDSISIIIYEIIDDGSD
jgi:Glu-tRNA(Gln) amidotransferase subunit E-like FAD-binding protein